MENILYTSRRVLIEGENDEFSLVDGGILVNGFEGKIEKVFTVQSDINNYLYEHPVTRVG